MALNAQQLRTMSGGGGGPGLNITAAGSGQGGFSININGSDVGAIILKTCDLNHDGTVSLTELKQVADACFKLWDTNNAGSLSADELSAALKKLFPAPPPGGAQAMAMVNGVAVQVPPDQMPTPDKQVAKHIMALADTNKDGLLSLQELNDWLDKSFSQWDQNGDGALDTPELDAAFGQLARPD
jgi:Ca2+-binding EF-hand superfamily protein